MSTYLPRRFKHDRPKCSVDRQDLPLAGPIGPPLTPDFPVFSGPKYSPTTHTIHVIYRYRPLTTCNDLSTFPLRCPGPVPLQENYPQFSDPGSRVFPHCVNKRQPKRFYNIKVWRFSQEKKIEIESIRFFCKCVLYKCKLF